MSGHIVKPTEREEKIDPKILKKLKANYRQTFRDPAKNILTLLKAKVL